MEIKNVNFQMYEEAAKALGVSMERITLSPKKKAWLFSYQNKFFVARSMSPGFYPQAYKSPAALTVSKHLTQQLLERAGFGVITTDTLKLKEFETLTALEAHTKSLALTYPLLWKPDRGMKGQGIKIIESESELTTALKEIFGSTQDILLQPILPYQEYRLLVINGEVILFYEKLYPHVTGDGTRTLKDLLNDVPEERKSPAWIMWQLQKGDISLTDILPEGSQFTYHLTAGITPDCNILDPVPEEAQKWALAVAEAFGASCMGIDLFIPGDISDTDSYIIIELNSNPGLHNLPKIPGGRDLGVEIFSKVLKDFFEITD